MRGLVVLATAAALAVLAAPSAQAADECRGLSVCIPVAGPWVVIPATTSPDDRYPQRSWRMKCPEGSIVAGVDARLTNRAVDMSFSGLLGSPVNPGITTRTRSSSPARTRAMHCGRPGSGPSSGAFPPPAADASTDRRQARVTDKAPRAYGLVQDDRHCEQLLLTR